MAEAGGAKRKREEVGAALASSAPADGPTVIAQLTDASGAAAGPPLELPADCAAATLEELLNGLLGNEEKLPYGFTVGNHELVQPLGEHLRTHKLSVEGALQIVYTPQALFRVRPVTRASSAMRGHAEAVLVVQFSPDGGRLASGSGDTTVRLWDLSTEGPKAECKGHAHHVLALGWSPDGVWVASGSFDGTVRVWDGATGRPKGGAYKGHRKAITGLCWEPAHLALPSSRMASASMDGTARVWDVFHSRCLLTLATHTAAVTSVKWGGDGLLYTASRDCTVAVWEGQEGKLVRQLKGHGHWVNTLALSAEHALRTGSFDYKGNCPEDAAEAKTAAKGRYDELTGGKPERLISGSDDFTMFLWEPSTSKKPVARMTGHVQLINHVVFSPDGRYVASASFDKAVKLWDGATGAFLATMRGHVAPVYMLAWSADARLLLSGSKDSTLKVWEARTRKLKLDLPGHADEVYAVDWAPNGMRAASGSKDKTVRVWRH